MSLIHCGGLTIRKIIPTTKRNKIRVNRSLKRLEKISVRTLPTSNSIADAALTLPTIKVNKAKRILPETNFILFIVLNTSLICFVIYDIKINGN
jgi:hypothetical protein